jgi:spore maturation protein CgeB
MKFLVSIPGLAHTIPMNHYVPDALRSLGHEVVVFNHERDNWLEKIREKTSKKRFIDYKNRQLMELIEKEKPDVFFSIYGRIHGAEIIKKIKKKNIITASWWLNDPFELGFQLAPAAEYDFYFTNSLYTHDDYRAKGVKNIHFLPVGIMPDLHKPMTERKYKYDVLFAGDHKPNREEILVDLIQKGVKVAIMGPWRKRKLKKENEEILAPFFINRGFFTPQQMVEAFQQSKIVLNVHTWLGIFDYGVNPRLFEASGSGAFQLCDDKKEISMLFEPQKEIVIYKKLEELPQLINYYLLHDKEREAIAEAAYQRVLRDHTYKQRMETVLSLISARKK